MWISKYCCFVYLCVQISIPDYEEKHDKKSYIVYKMNLEIIAGEPWVKTYRFSAFEELHQALKDKFANLPKFPGKSLLKLNEEGLEKRRRALEIYMAVRGITN